MGKILLSLPEWAKVYDDTKADNTEYSADY